MIRAAIIGAGNVGTAMLAMLCQRRDLGITVYSSRKNEWGNSIEYKSMEPDAEWKQASGFQVTDDLSETVRNADQIFITLPSFIREEFIDRMCADVREGTLIAFVPGCGGTEFFCKGLIERNCKIVGFERVPAVARLTEYGKSVTFEWKKVVRIAGLNVGGCAMKDICNLLSEELGLDFIPLKSFLAITLTPANPIMHPVRLYSMFQDKKRDSIITYQIPFYGEWDNETSKLLFQCDDELQELCRAIGTDEVVSLKKHYESDTPDQMTKKLHNIVSFKKVYSPLKPDGTGNYTIDFSSRYFVEDFPYGLFIIKDMAEICKVKTPTMDTIVKWYLEISGTREKQGNLLRENGIETVEDIRRFYRIQ